MRISLWLMVLFTRAIDMVATQGYMDPNIDSCEKCNRQYTSTFRAPRKGIFTSPDFPDEYSERTTCCYVFHAKEDGRVRIEFDYFDLEASDHECRYDYIEISSINKHGYKEQPKALYCGTTKPPVHISTHSKLEIIFHSDVTTNAKGFLGHYEFLDKYWHPFPPPTFGCEQGYLTGAGGVIQSPGFPDPYPNESACTWVIQAKPNQRVLLNFLSLDITNSGKCLENNIFNLVIYDGYVTSDKYSLRFCGQLKHEAEDKREYLSQGDRVVVRFETGPVNVDSNQGFEMVWTAVTIEKSGTCEGFECERVGTKRCDRSSGQELCKDQHFCIDGSLKCNEVPNCGVSDHSDETKCLNYIMRYVGIVGGAIAVVVVVIVIVVCCYKKRFSKDRIKYSVPKEQSLTQSMTHSFLSTQSSNIPVRSLDHSPRSSCVMYTTSFTDCGLNDHVTSPHHNNQNNSAKNLDSFTNANSLPLPLSERKQTPDVAEVNEESKDQITEDPAYKGHQKRPSYHMMRELCYEDGNIVLAEI